MPITRLAGWLLPAIVVALQRQIADGWLTGAIAAGLLFALSLWLAVPPTPESSARRV